MFNPSNATIKTPQNIHIPTRPNSQGSEERMLLSKRLLLSIISFSSTLWLIWELCNSSLKNASLLGIVLTLATTVSAALEALRGLAYASATEPNGKKCDGIVEGCLALPWLTVRLWLSPTSVLGNDETSWMIYYSLISSQFLLILLPGSCMKEPEHCLDTEAKSTKFRVINLGLQASNMGGILLTLFLWISGGGTLRGMADILLFSVVSGVVFGVGNKYLGFMLSLGEMFVVSQGLSILVRGFLYQLARVVELTQLRGSLSVLVDPGIGIRHMDNYILTIICTSIAILVPLSAMSRQVSGGALIRINLKKAFAVLICVWGAIGAAFFVWAISVVVRFVFTDAGKCGMLVWWILALGSGVIISKRLGTSQRVPNIILRKWFHFLALVLFLPGHMLQPQLLKVALAWAFILLVALEGARCGSVPVLGQLIHDFMTAFTDSRDSGPVILTHFTLLLGMAIPIWISSKESHVALAGVVILGIGDSAAAIIGSSFGRRKFCSDGDKTWEGTLSNFLCTLVAWWGLQKWYRFPFGSVVVPTLAAVCYEAATTQLDNIFLPLFYYAMLSG